MDDDVEMRLALVLVVLVNVAIIGTIVLVLRNLSP